MRSLAVIASILLASAAMAQATGQVVGTDGQPIPGVDVCAYKNGARADCVATDEKGFYRMEHPVAPNLFVQAKGYATTTVSAAPQNEPVVINRVAALFVRVVDAASGEPITKGTVTVNLPSGRKIGSPVPFNRSGVRMSTLPPGATLVRAEAEGYDAAGPIVVDLVGGQEKELKIPLKRSGTR
jgi:hypothetical protein